MELGGGKQVRRGLTVANDVASSGQRRGCIKRRWCASRGRGVDLSGGLVDPLLNLSTWPSDSALAPYAPPLSDCNFPARFHRLHHFCRRVPDSQKALRQLIGITSSPAPFYLGRVAELDTRVVNLNGNERVYHSAHVQFDQPHFARPIFDSTKRFSCHTRARRRLLDYTSDIAPSVRFTLSDSAAARSTLSDQTYARRRFSLTIDSSTPFHAPQLLRRFVINLSRSLRSS